MLNKHGLSLTPFNMKIAYSVLQGEGYLLSSGCVGEGFVIERQLLSATMQLSVGSLPQRLHPPSSEELGASSMLGKPKVFEPLTFRSQSQ